MAQSSSTSFLFIVFSMLLPIHIAGGPLKHINGQPGQVVFQERSSWCVAKPSANDAELAANIQFVCGQLKECELIQEGGSCYYPITPINHASVVMNLYYKTMDLNIWNCDFRGSALITETNPSHAICMYA